jgi:nucleoside 2-deoxyribosyltransferase
MITTLTIALTEPVVPRYSATEFRPLVYIAAPFTMPDPIANTHAVLNIADALWEAGFTPLIPHLSLVWHLVSPKRYETWLEYDGQLLARCDAVLRVPGFSVGATCETQFAGSLGIPVIHSRSVVPSDCVTVLADFFSKHEEPR